MAIVQDPDLQVTALTDKEWLDLSWKYFQHHAQQRVIHFNYFVVFSTILTTGYITTFQNNFSFEPLRIAIGVVQAFLAVFFAKIDERNSFLIKHAEDTIMGFEGRCLSSNEHPGFLFGGEVKKTLSNKGKAKSWLLPLMTHGQLYRIIYGFFFVIGIIEVLLFFFL
jgi:hypothetical protein